MVPRHSEAPLRRSPEPAQWPKPAATLVQSLRPAVILVEPAQSPKSADRARQKTASLLDTGGATAERGLRGGKEMHGTWLFLLLFDIIINRDSTCVRDDTLPQSRYCNLCMISGALDDAFG